MLFSVKHHFQVNNYPVADAICTSYQNRYKELHNRLTINCCIQHSLNCFMDYVSALFIEEGNVND